MTIDCLFERNDAGRFTCTVCGWTYPREADKPPRRNCPEAPNNIAARREQLTETLTELAPDSVADAMKIVDEHCVPCEQFTGTGCRGMGGCGRPDYEFAARLVGLEPPCERWKKS